MENYLQNVLKQFNIDANMDEYGDGHINETYRIKGQPYLLLLHT